MRYRNCIHDLGDAPLGSSDITLVNYQLFCIIFALEALPRPLTKSSHNSERAYASPLLNVSPRESYGVKSTA